MCYAIGFLLGYLACTLTQSVIQQHQFAMTRRADVRLRVRRVITGKRLWA